MVQQTEQLSKIMKSHAEELNSGPLHRLTMMIKDKQQVKKSYQSIHQQIEFELNKASAHLSSSWNKWFSHDFIFIKYFKILWFKPMNLGLMEY